MAATTAGFLAALLVTLGLLAAVVVTGLRARRRRHLTLVAATFVALAVTIVFAERLGRYFDLEATGRVYPVHLFLAKATVAAYLVPVVTGIWTIRDSRHRRLHGAVAWIVLGLTVLTAVTGTAMVVLAPRY